MDWKNSKRGKALLVGGTVALIMIVGGGGMFLHGLTHVDTDDAYVEGRIHSVAAKVPGTIVRVAVADNQAVKKGDVLLEIDPADYQLKAEEARAALDAEKARLEDSGAGVNTAKANLEVQMVALKQATLDFRRAESLFKEQVITKEKHEKATTAYRMAIAQVKAAKEQVVKAVSSLNLQASVIKQKEASLNIAALNLSYTRIVASTDGYVTKRSVETGNQVQSGQPLMALVALHDLWVVANFKETQLKKVKPGQKVSMAIDTYPGVKFSGTVDSVMAGTGAVFSLFPPENALGNYVKVVQRVPVKIMFDEHSQENHPLRIGMSVVPTIHLDE